MVDFGALGKKAKEFVDEHEKQVDDALEKASDAAGRRFGHADQIDKAADKLQGMTGKHRAEPGADGETAPETGPDPRP